MSQSTATSRIAFFFSTSGHSGVDKSVQLLIPELCQRGYHIDLLRVRKHGPYVEEQHNLRQIDLGTAHTMTALRAVMRYLRDNQPTALLADKDRCNRVALLAKRLAQSPTRVVVSSGTIMSENLKRRSWLEKRLHHWSFAHLYPHAHAIITPSRDAAVDLAKISPLSLAQISVVPLPIITNDLQQLAREPVEHPWLVEKTQPVIVSVGELNDRKDQSTQLRAFAQLRRSRVCKLLILGKGGDLEKLQQLAKQLNIDDDVDFLGFQSNPYPYIAAADVFIHTAKFEGFGMVMVEALALGTQVVASNCIGGPNEILNNGEFGRLVGVGDTNGLAEAIEKSIVQPLASAQQLRNSVAKYTVASSTNSYLDALGLASHPTGSAA